MNFVKIRKNHEQTDYLPIQENKKDKDVDR